MIKNEHKCTKCGGEKTSKTQRWCNKCSAKYMRAWRKNHSLTEDQKKKDNARSSAGVYLRRGKIRKESCFVCGSDKTEMHHKDYDKPLDIEWMCRSCHLWLHDNCGQLVGN